MAHQKTLKLKKLQVRNTITNVTRIVSHYQLMDWPDGDVPSKKGRKTLNIIIDAFLHFLS